MANTTTSSISVDTGELKKYTAIQGHIVTEMQQQKNTAAQALDDLSTRMIAIYHERTQLISSMTTLMNGAIALQEQLNQSISQLTIQIASLSSQLNSLDAQLGSFPLDSPEQDAVAAAGRQVSNQYNVLADDKRVMQSQVVHLDYYIKSLNAKINNHHNIALATDENSIANIIRVENDIDHTSVILDARAQFFTKIYNFAHEMLTKDTIFSQALLGNVFGGLESRLLSDLDKAIEPGDGVPLIDGGVSSSDVQQGSTGDCWLLSIVASIAHQDPATIRNMITVTGPGKYNVVLHGQDGKIINVTVTENDLQKILKKNGGDASRAVEEWPAVIEAAVTKTPQIFTSSDIASGKRNPVHTGGTYQDMSDAYKALTGKKAISFPSIVGSNASVITSMTSKKQAEALAKAIKTGSPVWAATLPGKPAGAPEQFVGSHAFSVIAITTKDGKSYVTLRNPWDAGKGTDHGIFTIPYDEFTKYWPQIGVGAP